MTTANPSKHTSSKSSKKRSAHKVHTLPLATMAALLTAATCLGSQPAMAVPTTTIPTTTQDRVVRSLKKAADPESQNREYVPLGDKKPWLQHPNILEFRRLRGRNSDATEITSDEEGSDKNWKFVNDRTAMYAHVETRDNSDYLIFDVFFNNNAESMVSKSNKQWYLWQVPYAIADLNSDGLYKSDTVTNLRYDAYRPKTKGHILSQDPEAFQKDDSLSFSVSNMTKTDQHFGKKGYALYQVGIGLNPNKVNDDLDQIFHKNGDDPLISRMAGDQAMYAYNNGQQYNKNYGLGITVAKPYDDVAYHMHAELKLRPGAINKSADNYNDKYANIQNAWTWANSGSWGATTSSAYTVISGRDPSNDEDKDGKLGRNKTDSIAPKIYYKGTEITNDKQTINLHTNDKLSFTTTDNKGYIEKFSISGLPDTSITKQGVGSENTPLSSGDITVTQKMNGKKVIITSEDGSGNVTKRKVKVRVTTLAKEHPLKGKTIDVTVDDKLPELTDIDKFVEITDEGKLEKKPVLKWNGNSADPDTKTVGVFPRSIKGTYSDDSTSIAKPVVTINVKPKKPVIDTDLANLAGKKGQKVTVSVVGDGIPKDKKVTTTVKLFDKNGKEIGSTTTIKNGKAEITVKDGIPEGDVYATTTVTKPDEKTAKITIQGFELTSEKSDTKQATAPKDTQNPTITATADSSSVTVGQDLKIHIVATDDVKVEKINYIDALMGANLLQQADIVGGRASVLPETTNTDQKKVLDLTVTKMQPKEVGTHTITFTVTDSAGKTGSTTLTITVKPDAPTVTVPTSGKDQGSATITPAADTDTLEITYTPEGEANEKTITVKKGNDGNWTGENIPTGVTVDKATGKVTIPADKIKDNSEVKAKDSKNGTKSDEKTGQTGTNPTTPVTTKPDAPTVTVPTSGKDQGSATITPAADTDTLEITYTPEGEANEKTITVKKGNDGNWTGENIPTGVTVDKATGKVTIPADKIKDSSDVKAKDKKGNTSSDEATGKAGTNGGNSGSETGSETGSGSETGNSNSSESDSGNDSTSNNDGSDSGSTTGGSSSTDSGAQNSTNESSSADNANNAGNAETGNAGNGNAETGKSGNGKAGNASTGASGSNASTKSGNKVPAKHSSQLVNTGAEVERVGLISAMIAVLGAAAAFFSRKKNRE
ncbi:hypothetical protein ACMZ89_00445 [Gardnerella vaginalis]|uniref:hypothetical protein n=1 Tax=Gardnerella vaginalis TaxID=2702 RepID=UPI0039F02DBE